MPILGTQSLSQLVAIRPEVAGRVDARKTFHDAGAGQRLQARFFPLAPQVEALRAAAEAAVKGGCMLFAGSPGTGKSMLLFLLGKALSAPFPGDEFSHLLDKIKEPRALRSLGAARKAGQQWLVVYPTASEKEDFDQSVRQALNGALFNQGVTDFAPQAGARLREDFAETATHLKSHREFQGIAVLFDGMDDFIDELLEEPGSPVSEQVRDFCAFCAESRFPIFFLGVVERELGLFTVEQESQLLKLFPAIQPVTLLGQPGEWEELVSSMVLEHVPGENWNELVNHADMKEVLSSLVRVGLYSGFSERWVKEVVLEGSYPLHPAALFALPRVALRLATASRTAFTFLSDPAPGGLVYFLNNFAVAQPNGRLSMYTADSLFTYFEKSLTDDPHNADFLQTLQKSMMLAGDIPQARRLLRLVLIFQMVSHERLRTRQDDLIWALHVGEREERIARRSLDLLVQKGALRHVEATQEYLLPLERPSITLDEALPRVKNRLRGELDVAALLLRRFPPPRVEARAFNLKHNTDRAVFGRYLRASELEDPQALLTQVRELAGRPRPYKGDLMVAYVLAENASDVERVRGACREGALSHPRLVVALTKEPRDFGNEALNILALERLKATEPPFSDPTSRERKELEERLAAAQKLLEERFRDMLRAENLEYYYQGRREDLPDEDSFHHYCNLRVAELLGEPPVLRERSLTCLADRGRSRAERQAALNYLLSCRGPLALRSDAGAVGRILRAGLLESGIFESAGVVGVWENFQLAHNPPNRGLAKAYRHLVDQIAGKDETHRWVPVAPLITGLLEPPFSLTPAMVELLLAVLVWRWRR
ncbi:MAG TPA: hypothetical protein VNO81_02585, partial [Candidatus Nitrosotenuis sp.]|nr:hypothetical protein [Candidatus Nitrosotenuis sp.]